VEAYGGDAISEASIRLEMDRLNRSEVAAVVTQRARNTTRSRDVAGGKPDQAWLRLDSVMRARDYSRGG
jgi:hypothetical protein